MFARKLIASWGDMDMNGHLGNTGYLDKATDIRMTYFAENGFSLPDFMRLRVGPVVMKDEIEYFREVHLLEEVTVTHALAGLAEDGSRMLLHNEVLKADGSRAARIRSLGGWMDLAARKLIAPPDQIFTLLRQTDRTEDFQVLPSSLKK